MNCLRCGTINNENSKFCIGCGAQLGGIENNTEQLNSPFNNYQEMPRPVQEASQPQVQSSIQQPVSQSIQQSINSNLNTQQNEPKKFDNYNEVKNYSSKKKINNKLLIIIAVAILIIVVAILGIPKIFHSRSNNIDSITETSSFFISNDSGKYALFSVDGKQLTDFEFKYAKTEFINGTQIVQNSDNEYGIISSTGKMIVDFGVYKDLDRSGALYTAEDKEYNSYLLDSKGKVLKKLEDDEDIDSFIGVYELVILESNTKYTFLDHNGNTIITIPVVEDEDDYSTSMLGDYISFFYNNNNYLISISDKKIILSFAENRKYCINAINENNEDELILNACSSWYESKDKYAYKFVRNGKIIYSKEYAKSASMYFEGDNVIFNSDAKYVLDKDGNNALKVKETIYKDYQNYVKTVDGILNGAELYVNGTVKEKISCNTIESGYASQGIYLLGNCQGYGNRKYIYYKSDGTRLNQESYKKANKFDANGKAIVTIDGNTYYLINTKGEKISDEYSALYSSYNYYIATDSNKTKILLDKDLKELARGKGIKITDINNELYAIIENDGNNTLYNLNKRKELITVPSSLDTSSSKYYFTTKKDSKTQYYAYATGKLVYEQ